MSPKILLVDDVKMFLQIEQQYLRLTSARILTALNGVEALQRVRDEHPDLVFMDLHMPKMDGAEACRRIKQFSNSIPVVMVTAHGKEEDQRVCVQAGCDDFITKPIDDASFLSTARRFLPALKGREERVTCLCTVRFKVYGVTLSGQMMDISRRGAFLACEIMLEPGTPLELGFSLPGLEQHTVRVIGRVAWSSMDKLKHKSCYPCGMGVEIVSVPIDSQDVIDQYLDNIKA